MQSGPHYQRKHRSKPLPGSSRWFRRYRIFVVLGWLLVLGAGAWILFSPPTGRVVVRAEPVAPAPAAAPAVAGKASADDAPHGSADEG